MAVSSTTFEQRMNKINSGKTTCCTVPGQGLAEVSDERKFLSKSAIKTRTRSTQAKRSPLRYIVALMMGAGSVIAARWIDFTYFDTAMAFAAEKGLDAAAVLSGLPVALALAVLISVLAMFVFGLGSKKTVPLQVAGFVGTALFEADLVALAPTVYANFYPPSWVADMVASATLLT